MQQEDRAGEDSSWRKGLRASADEPTIHSFIIKIWVDGTGAGGSAWTGSITHVPSNVRRSLGSLEDIVAFIAPFLAQKGK